VSKSQPLIRSPLAFGVVILLAAAVAVWMYWAQPWQREIGAATTVVAPVSFLHYVRERGHVEPARVAQVRSEIPSNQAKLVWLRAEGEKIVKGALVAQFDTKPFMDKLEKAGQSLVDAESKVRSAEQALQLQREENEARMEAVERKLEIAEIKANDLREGTGKLARRKLLLAIEQAGRKHRIAIAERQDFEELLGTGHVSQREFDKVADELIISRESLALSRDELANFDRYEMPRLLREAELLVDEAKSETARIVRTITLELNQRENELTKRQHDFKVAVGQQRRARQNVANCDVRAPIGGTLLYLVMPREGQKQKPQLGDAIWYRQAFMAIPDTRELVVEIRIREIDLAHLQTGATAEIELDAFPGQKYQGELLSVGSVAEATDNADQVRQFRGQVRFEMAPENVHVGMSADVKIVIQSLENVLAVPVQSVVYRQGKPGVRLRRGDSRTWREIETGTIGNRWIEVLGGLEAGDEIEVAGN